MRWRLGLVLVGALGLSGGVFSQGELEFFPAQVAVSFSPLDARASMRDALKGALERGQGAINVAVNDFSDVPLELVLIRLSNSRPVRVLLGVGGADPQAETRICEEMSELFPVRRAEGVGHHFAALGGQSVVLSSMDWAPAALSGPAQGVIEVQSPAIAQRYQARFEALWATAKPACR